jgi:delta-aminolevulinic acid dehydratase/porphobilinogen synthase
MSSQFETSINKMKESFTAIAAAKTHTVVLDFVPNRKTTGKAGTTTKTVVTKVVKPVAKPVEKLVVKPAEAEYTKKPEGIQGVIAEEVISKTAKKPAPKKNSKLSKMLCGKTVDLFN